MNTVTDTFFSALVAQTGAGEPLNAVLGKLWKDEQDFVEALKHTKPDTPWARLRVGGSREMPVMKGSRHVMHEGVIRIVLLADTSATADDGWDTARETVETLAGNFGRVLAGLRYSAGAWDDMSWETESSEPGSVNGADAWERVIACTFRFARYRAT